VEKHHQVICFGDIHGHPGAAQTAVSLAEQLGIPAVFLGDYVDRGPDSHGVLRIIMQASERHPDWIFLLGNHDLMLMQAFEGERHPYGYDERTVFETLPTIPGHKHPLLLDFLKARPIFHRKNQCLFVHGGFKDPHLPIESLGREELTWTYGIPEGWRGETVVRGHAVVEKPEIGPYDININTMCGYGGSLTGLLLNTTDAKALQIWQISEDGDLSNSFDLE